MKPNALMQGMVRIWGYHPPYATISFVDYLQSDGPMKYVSKQGAVK